MCSVELHPKSEHLPKSGSTDSQVCCCARLTNRLITRANKILGGLSRCSLCIYKPTDSSFNAAAEYVQKLHSGELFTRFPNLTHLTLGERMTFTPDSLPALSKLQSLEINPLWQGARPLLSHLTQLPSLRTLAMPKFLCKPSRYDAESVLGTDLLHQVCR